ncbi:hypothetical protein [Ruminococcus albus]|nr:hypothetical protein [Ruminococcus albus]
MLRIRNTYNSKGEKLSRSAEIHSCELSGLLGEVVSRRSDSR